MVVTQLIAKFRAVTAGLAATAFFLANPAGASSANVDLDAPLRAAQTAKQSVSGADDEQFRKLFSNWQSYEQTGVPALAAVAEATEQAGMSMRAGQLQPAVSIPSRMPVEGVRLSSDFGMRTHPVTGQLRGHKGVDLAGRVGTPIYATGSGVVSRASWYGSYGLYVAIEHGSKIQTRYAHMSRLNVAEGQRVEKGDVIGFIGSTGRSTGPHLHYEVRIDGEAVNPVPFMQATRLAHAAASGSRLGIGGPD